MSSLAEFCAAILLWLSSMALCQFGMTVEHHAKVPPKVERVIARTPQQRLSQGLPQGVSAKGRECPRLHAVAVNA